MDSIAGILAEHVRRRPDATALVQDHRSLTFSELDGRVNRCARGLRALGAGPGERVAVLDRNCIEYFDVMFAVSKIGAVMCGVNFRIGARELVYILNDCGAEILVVGADYVPLLEGVLDQLTSLRHVLVLGAHDRWPDYTAWLDGAPADPIGEPVDPAAVVCQVYTSGTTGNPKGVLLPNYGFAEFVRKHQPAFLMDENTVQQVVLPMFHIGGVDMSLVAFAAGGTNVLIRNPFPATVLASLSRDRITHAGLVAALMAEVLAEPDIAEHDLSALRVMAYGAAPMPEDVLRRAVRVFGCDFVQSYGMTESCGGFAVLEPEAHRLDGPHTHRLRAAGRALPGVELRIADPDTLAELPVGQPGEVQVRSRQMMLGYWNRPEATAETLLADGWLRTGDVGHLDVDGYLYLRDRLKDVIISGGENVYPAEVENELFNHPGLSDVAVVGVPSPRWGETPKAIVVLAPGAQLTEADLIAFVRSRIAGYKCPTSVEFVDELPRNASGKILKRELRKPYWDGHDRAVS